MGLKAFEIGHELRTAVAFAMLGLAACGRSDDKVVNYNLKLTHAPVCPFDGDRAAGNNLKRVLMVKAETSSRAFTSFSYSGRNDGVGKDGVVPTGAQVMLAKSGKQTVKFRFGACPSKDKPTGTEIKLGCEDSEIKWYAERDVAFDPNDMVVFGEPGESRTTVDWPWPASELECWTGLAAPYPAPL